MNKGILTAINTDGKVKWKYEAGDPIDASPIIYKKKVIFGTEGGVLQGS